MSYKSCVFNGKPYPTIAAAAATVGISPSQFAKKVNKFEYDDFAFITTRKYEKLTGLPHPSTLPRPKKPHKKSEHTIVTELLCAWPKPRRLSGFVNPDYIALLSGICLGLIMAFLVKTAKADEYGSYCISKNGVERCTIWQWSSKQQRLVKKEVTRASD